MSKWDEMTVRERDAWVAEHVMGYVWFRYQTATGTNRATLMTAFGKGQCDQLGMTPSTRTDELYDTSGAPGYTTDASADYLVLCKVREAEQNGMPIVEWEKYLDALFQCLCESTERPRCSGHRTYEFIVNYAVGTYSHAAFLALEGK